MAKALAYSDRVGFARRRWERRGPTVGAGPMRVTPVETHTALVVRIGTGAALLRRSSPTRVEISEDDGSRKQVFVVDFQRRARRLAIATIVAAFLIGLLKGKR